jgi:hypothetical protein
MALIGILARRGSMDILTLTLECEDGTLRTWTIGMKEDAGVDIDGEECDFYLDKTPEEGADIGWAVSDASHEFFSGEEDEK